MSGFDDNPFLASLGAHIEEWVDDQVPISLAVQPAHLNQQGVMQGGLVCSLLDTACGYAGISTNDPARAQGVTISLAINFLGSVRGGTVTTVCKVTGRGRKIYFSQAEIQSPDGTVIATAQGSFKCGAPKVPGEQTAT